MNIFSSVALTASLLFPVGVLYHELVTRRNIVSMVFAVVIIVVMILLIWVFYNNGTGEYMGVVSGVVGFVATALAIAGVVNLSGVDDPNMTKETMFTSHVSAHLQYNKFKKKRDAAIKHAMKTEKDSPEYKQYLSDAVFADRQMSYMLVDSSNFRMAYLKKMIKNKAVIGKDENSTITDEMKNFINDVTSSNLVAATEPEKLASLAIKQIGLSKLTEIVKKETGRDTLTEKQLKWGIVSHIRSLHDKGETEKLFALTKDRKLHFDTYSENHPLFSTDRRLYVIHPGLVAHANTTKPVDPNKLLPNVGELEKRRLAKLVKMIDGT